MSAARIARHSVPQARPNQPPPGHYELVCNERGHYAVGMFTELDVR